MNGDLEFQVLPAGTRAPHDAKNKGFLLTDNWDDWFEFSTLYSLVVSDAAGVKHDIGGVKIGQVSMSEGQRRPDLPARFIALDESFFSLGQDDSYYEVLSELGTVHRDSILSALRDVAASESTWEAALKERVTRVSLLRSVTPRSVEGQFRRLAKGGARLSSYRFTYRAPRRVGSGSPPVSLSFNVIPESSPPTNIHVLIGRNGVGKTHLLNLMTRALVEKDASPRQVGAFEAEDPSGKATPFANVVSVTFSAFDPFEPLPEQKDKSAEVRYSYVGLKRDSNTGQGVGTPKSPDMLAREFVKSVLSCLQGARSARWKRALQALEADPIFQEADVSSLAEDDDKEDFEKRASGLFGRLSSGHKIVLLTITRLVETVEEQSLVLLDEPEAHLHPPLLSAFVRSLSDLLINRNGVAVIATHSPVVLQEVPKSCVWKLRRTGNEVSAERPEIETFGENVGVLTREIFGLEVTQSGFHKMLSDAVKQEATFEDALERFDRQFGAEALAITRALVAAHDADRQS
jgi:hypothetical protein